MKRESALQVVTPADLKAEIAAWKSLIDRSLDQHLTPREKLPQPRVHEAIRGSTLGGGHRYRPILLLAVADAFGVSKSCALPMACIVEMIHTAAMILDDLPSFDNADVRHGKPACHRQFGEYIAILASQLLLCLTVFC